MGDLAGTWHIYSQKIGEDVVLKPEMKIEIDDSNTCNFELVQGASTGTGTRTEAVTFRKAPRSQHYLGKSKSYQYRVQIFESNGSKILAGQVFTKVKQPTHKLPEYRSAFVGLRQKAHKKDFAELELSIDIYSHGSLYTDGRIHISGEELRLSMKNPYGQEVTIDHIITQKEADGDGTHLIARGYDDKDQSRLVLTNQVEALILFDANSRPVYVGYHWRPTAEDAYSSGMPTDQRCNLVTTGLG